MAILFIPKPEIIILYLNSGKTKAQLYGGEARIDIHPHPLDWLHFENAISVVYALNLGGNGAVINDSNKYLPFIPPLHTTSELIAEFKKKVACFSDIYFKVGMQYYATQDRLFFLIIQKLKHPAMFYLTQVLAPL